MTFTRTLKRLISLALIGVLFCAQMALAAYVCPMQTGAAFAQNALGNDSMASMSAMPGCDGMDVVAMDADSSGLCHASCNSAGQSDHTPTLKLPVAALQSLPYVVFPATPETLVGRAAQAHLPQSAAASPPLSVLYCCFRI